MWAFLSCHWPGECAVHGQKRFFNVQQREAAIEMNMKKKNHVTYYVWTDL